MSAHWTDEIKEQEGDEQIMNGSDFHATARSCNDSTCSHYDCTRKGEKKRKGVNIENIQTKKKRKKSHCNNNDNTDNPFKIARRAPSQKKTSSKPTHSTPYNSINISNH